MIISIVSGLQRLVGARFLIVAQKLRRASLCPPSQAHCSAAPAKSPPQVKAPQSGAEKQFFPTPSKAITPGLLSIFIIRLFLQLERNLRSISMGKVCHT